MGQKYRLYLRRLSGVSQHQGGLSNSFISSSESTFGSVTSLNQIDLIAATVQFQPQSLATLQAAGLGRSTAKSGLPMPLVDQRNLFSFENPKLRFGEGQQQHMSSSKPMNLLHGIPTTMEPKQLANLHHQSAHSLGGVNLQVNGHGAQRSNLLMQIAQPHTRGQMLNEAAGGHVPRLPSSMGQPIVSNGIPGGVLGRNGIVDNGRGSGYDPILQNSSLMNFPLNHAPDLPGNSFPLGSTPGLSSLASKGAYPDEVTSEIKGSAGFMPSYDIFNDLNQHKSNDWDIQNVGITFDASQHSNSMQGNLDVSSSVLVHQGFSSNQGSLQNRHQSNVSKAMFSVVDGIDHGHTLNMNQHLNTLLGDNSIRVKTESVPDASSQTTFFPEQIGQEDLMSALLKQVSFPLFMS